MPRSSEASASTTTPARQRRRGPRADALRNELSKVVRTLARRAQAAGTMRRDVTGEDALLAVCTIGRAQPLAAPEPGALPGGAVEGAWRRLVRIILDGMRPPSP